MFEDRRETLGLLKTFIGKKINSLGFHRIDVVTCRANQNAENLRKRTRGLNTEECALVYKTRRQTCCGRDGPKTPFPLDTGDWMGVTSGALQRKLHNSENDPHALGALQSVTRSTDLWRSHQQWQKRAHGPTDPAAFLTTPAREAPHSRPFRLSPPSAWDASRLLQKRTSGHEVQSWTRTPRRFFATRTAMCLQGRGGWLSYREVSSTRLEWPEDFRELNTMRACTATGSISRRNRNLLDVASWSK